MTIHFQHLPITAKTVRILGMILILFLFSSLTVRHAQAAPLLQTGCTLPATVTTTNELSDCITEANANGAGLDTITLGANITLSAALPQITTAIVVEGAGYFIDGADTYRMFSVGSTGNLTINQATLQNGYSGGNGGAIENLGVLTVNRSTLSSNTAFFAGGGINNAGTLTIIHSTISGNTTNITGGGGVSNSGPLTVTNSTFSGNTAAGSGGAIFNYETPLTVTNSTFSGNSAPSGGAIFGQYTNSTLNLAGNIFVTGANGANCANGGVVVDNGYNLSNDATCTNGGFGSQTNATLNLGPLADNGGPTPTHLPGAGSAAINAIPFGYVSNNNGVLMACNQTTTDQIGQYRPLIANTACTSGAVEVASPVASLTIIKDASPAIGTDFDFTINSAPLGNYSGTTSGKPTWRRPSEGTTCTLSPAYPRYHVQAFVVDTSGFYSLLSTQFGGWSGYIHLYQDNFNPLAPCTNYLNGDDNGITTSSSEIVDQFLEAGRTYYFVTSANSSSSAGNFTNSVLGAGTAYPLYESFILDDAVPDDSDGVNASATFAVTPGTYAVTEAGLSGWGLTGATCTGASGSVSLTGDTLSVQVSNGEAVQCTFTNETLCPASGIVTTEDELTVCITLANANESPSPTADTITLGANITLTTALPQITSEITLEGAGYAVDGDNSVRLFYINTVGNFTVNQTTLQNGSSGGGSAIVNASFFSTVTVTNSTLSHNTASVSGGAIDNAGTLTVINSTLSYNNAVSGQGGAIYSIGILTVVNSTFSNNVAGTYGGALSSGGGLRITNSTFSGNSAPTGGGIDFYSAHLAGNVFAAGVNGANCFNFSGTITDNGYNLSDDASCGFSGTGSANNATLNLGALADNGGSTLTHLPGAGSDAIGAIPYGTTINNNGVTLACNQTTTDQLGTNRPINSGDNCTSGAVEVTPICTSWTVTTAVELSECITLANANESPSPTADTITLGADITLTTALPQIASEITLEGANHFIDGGNSVQLFYVNYGDFTVNQTTLQNGSATNGGGIHNYYGTLTVTNSTLSGNSATKGGSIYDLGTLMVANSTFSGNSATKGGGVYNEFGPLTVTNSTFSNNTATGADGGGGIANDSLSAVANVTNSTFFGNTAVDGGGIYNVTGGTLMAANNTFSSNTATGDGGGIQNYGTLTITNSTFSGNTATGDGGGIYTSGSTAPTTVTNSTFYSNTATAGNGGAVSGNQVITITNSTIFGNSASAGGGGVNIATTNGIMTLNNTIVAGNTGGDCQRLYSAVINAQNSLIGDGLSCVNGTNSNNLSGDPMLNALASNGGSTQTMALQDTSPAINAGDNTLASGLIYDQRGAGFDRVYLSTVDIGAYELVYTPDFVVDTTSDDDLRDCSTAPNDCSLRGAINVANTLAGTDTITFDSTVFATSQTITLTSALPHVTTAIIINGSGESLLTVDGVSRHRVFYLDNADLTLTDMTIANGRAGGVSRGGGAYVEASTLTAANVTFSGNIGSYGGAISLYGGSTLTLTDCTMSNNNSTGSSASQGGALYIAPIDNSAQLTRCTLTNNNARLAGGIYSQGTLTINDSLFDNNTATGSPGGAIYMSYGTTTVNQTTFTNNRATLLGGGIFAAGGNLIVGNSTFAGNMASTDGGAIGVQGSITTLVVFNSTFSGNSAVGAGGALNLADTILSASITNSTIAGNTAATSSGIRATGTTTLTNNIIAYNTGSANQCDLGANPVTIQHTLIQDGSCGVGTGPGYSDGNLSGDPLLNALASNGGSTQTMALQNGSPAIDAGNNATCETTDQRGVNRPINGSCDIGAYEGGTLVCSISNGSTYTFPEQSGVAIHVVSTTDLGCLYVEEMPLSHPYATGAGEGQALRTGKYWRIRALQDASGTTANSYVANLTLPHNNLNNPQACKYTGGAGYGWECAADASTSSTVTRNGLTSFSDWAVGGDVGPTAVSLQSIAVTSNRQAGMWLAVLVMGLITAVGLWRRRTGQSS